jgi:hypothetical protein
LDSWTKNDILLITVRTKLIMEIYRIPKHNMEKYTNYFHDIESFGCVTRVKLVEKNSSAKFDLHGQKVLAPTTRFILRAS